MMQRRIGQWMRTASVLMGLLLCLPLLARDEIAIIVAKDSTEVSIDRRKLRDIYLKKLLLAADGSDLIPVNLPPDHPLRLSLSETLFHKSAQQLQDYWNQRYFHGITPPYVLHSQEAVVQFVAKTPGAIGYIAACRLNDQVREVLKLSVPAARRQALEELCLSKQDSQ
jgi:ABC-type phosphate transport system substrate-binding protein